MRSLRLASVLLLGFLGLALADEDKPRRTEGEVIRSCLASWPDNPFRGEDSPRYRTLGSSISVFGIGGDVVDDVVTADPQLVLVKPSVNVMTKGRFRLLNPNGWYCFENAVTVLAKSEIVVHCNAHLASSVQSAAVVGSNAAGADGVTVLGKAVVQRVGCEGERPGS